MAFSTGNTSITLEELRKRVSDITIASHYLGISKVPCIINSPLRPDNNPSLSIYTKDGVTIKWTDFGTKESGSIYDLLMKIWKCSFTQVLNRIYKDFQNSTSNLISNNNISRKKVNLSNISNCKIIDHLRCRAREWKDYDIKYWESYGIPIKWLKYAEVYPITHKIIYKGGQRYVLGADKYAYAFVEHKEGHTTIKIYQPFNKKYKWSNSHDGSVISLWTKIPQEGEQICICSSLKDALCLWANTGIPAIAVQGEGYSLSSTACKELRRRFKRIYILFDNDKPGLEDGKKLSEQTGFINLTLPQFDGGKDISDLYKCVGKNKFNVIVSELFNTNPPSK